MISIMGCGKVGSTIAFLCASLDLDDIQLLNRTKKKAIGEAFDISNTLSPNSSKSVVAANYSDLKNSEVVVIAASSATYEKNRLEFLPKQICMIKKIAQKVKIFAPSSKALIVSNPVDLLSYVFQKESKFPRERVIGIASSLDSSRFRFLLAQELQTKPNEIKHPLVLGEHGDTMVPIFSYTTWKNSSVKSNLNLIQTKKITRDLQNYWKRLRRLKGASNFGISKHTVNVLQSILNDEHLNIPASVKLEGEYGLTDVNLGVPIVISKNGVSKIQEIQLAKNEKDSLLDSGKFVKKYLKKFNY